MTDTPAPKKPVAFSVLVGVAAGLISCIVGAFTIWATLFPSPDTQFDRMISTAEGMQTALERIATTIEDDPALVGEDVQTATTLAKTAQTVTKTVQSTAATKGITIRSSDLWGDSLTVGAGAPVLLETSRGVSFGIGRQGMSNLYLNRQHRYINEGDLHRFDVGDEKCEAFVNAIKDKETIVTVRCL
jgi:hypothetical protein